MLQRDELILEYREYARSLARQIHRKLPRHVDYEELAAYADVGLVEAAGAFDPEYGTNFKTFSYYHVRGAVFDGIQQMSGLPRRVRQEVALMEGHNDVERELAGREGCDDETLASTFSQVAGRTAVVVLLSQIGDEDSAEPADEATPDRAAEEAEIVQRLRAAVGELPERYGRLLRMHYMEHRSLSECGRILKKDKATMSRWHALAISELRERMSEAGVAL